MSGGSTISTSDTKLNAIKFQSSAYGGTIPVVYGVTRIPGNMLWYGGFKAIPHTSTQSQGGKGGSVKTQQTTYSYSAAVIMGLCEGQIIGVGQVWRGKTLYQGGATPTQIVSTNFSGTVPGGGVVTVPMAGGASFAANTSVIAPGGGGDGGTSTSWLVEGTDYTRSGAVFTFQPQWVGYFITFDYQYTIAGTQQSSLQQLNLSFQGGALGQAVWSYLTTNFPAQAIGYSGFSYVYSSSYDLGTDAAVENHNFEIQAKMAYSIGPTIPDANPARACYDLLTNSRYGANFLGTRVYDITTWSNYCLAAGLLLSPALTEQTAAADMVVQFCKLTNTAPVWSEGVLKFIPFGDTPLSGNGVTYTPNTTAVYDLTDNDFQDKEQPVSVSRKAPSEAYNQVTVEFFNRANQYNIEIAEAKDQANIDVYGLRAAPVFSAHWCCNVAVARAIAQLQLQRMLYIRNTYSFKLDFTKALLEPMDIVTLTDPLVGTKYPVRITAIAENDNDFSVEAEDFPLGVATNTLYPSQAGAGFSHNYNVAPGNVNPPIIFEAPVELTTSGLEVYAAATGSDPNWGGCNVWVSLDGTNYRQVAKLSGGSRMGALTGPISAGVLPVGGLGAQQLISGSAADAAAYNTLCFVGTATNPEYLAYTTAALTGPGAYNLSGLVRGIYSTAQVAHATSDPFVRVDAAIAKSGSLDLSRIGSTISFKFTSFNIYGGGEQGLADVSPYTYTIAGYMAALPPKTPTGFVANMEGFGVRLKVNQNAEPDVRGYRYYVGPTFAGAAVLEPLSGTSFLWAVQTSGSYTFWCVAVDALGNISTTPASAMVSVVGGAVSNFMSALLGIQLNLNWDAAPGSFAVSGYEVRYGATWATATFAQFVQSNKYAEIVKWGGSRTYWVAVVDVKGNYGTPVSLNVTINAPGAVTGSYSTVVDNNVLLYWFPPASGDLPVERYEVRKGASWAGGAIVGSNGNSTFAAIFEQQSGTYTYWVTAYDSAGNVGTPVGITSTVNQPPDYILRNNYDSPLLGTLTNLYREGAVLLGPTDVTQTWATHFTSNSWTTPAQQVSAGFPIYIEPSVTSGAYEEVIDYGTILPPTIITSTLTAVVLAGTVNAAVTISYKALIGDPWTVATPGQNQVFAATGFRYVRIHYDFTCTAGANLISISALNVKLSIKLKTDSGTGTITTASTGVVVNFNVAFVDADTPIVQPGGTTPLIPVVDFTDIPNPTTFTVYLYNTSGVKVTGSFSWTARGY